MTLLPSPSNALSFHNTVHGGDQITPLTRTLLASVPISYPSHFRSIAKSPSSIRCIASPPLFFSDDGVFFSARDFKMPQKQTPSLNWLSSDDSSHFNSHRRHSFLLQSNPRLFASSSTADSHSPRPEMAKSTRTQRYSVIATNPGTN